MELHSRHLFCFRSQIETVSAERDALKESVVKFTEEKEMLIVESEDTAQKLEKQHEAKLRYERQECRNLRGVEDLIVYN